MSSAFDVEAQAARERLYLRDDAWQDYVRDVLLAWAADDISMGKVHELVGLDYMTLREAQHDARSRIARLCLTLKDERFGHATPEEIAKAYAEKPDPNKAFETWRKQNGR